MPEPPTPPKPPTPADDTANDVETSPMKLPPTPKPALAWLPPAPWPQFGWMSSSVTG